MRAAYKARVQNLFADKGDIFGGDSAVVGDHTVSAGEFVDVIEKVGVLYVKRGSGEAASLYDGLWAKNNASRIYNKNAALIAKERAVELCRPAADDPVEYRKITACLLELQYLRRARVETVPVYNGLCGIHRYCRGVADAYSRCA
jgi:hypothetical protein